MCGIYCSKDYKTFKGLYNLNKQRGDFATGHLFLTNQGDYQLERFPGKNNYDEYPTMDAIGHYDIFLGHTQSPTGSVREYNHNTSHPFETKNWIVAHNGVINNYKDIIKKYIPDHDIDVDTSVIPAYMEYILKKTGGHNDIDGLNDVVKTALNELSGTYAVFIFNKPNNVLYIARSGSTLFYNKDTLEFSSVVNQNLEPVPDYTLHQLNHNSFEKVANLKNNSSFIIF